MFRRAMVLVCGCVAAAVLSAGAGADTFSGTVFASVVYNSDCSFTLAINTNIVADSSAGATTTLPPGPYQLSISTASIGGIWDTSYCDEADFSLTGPGVSYSGIFGIGSYPFAATTTVTLQPASTYTMVDQARPSQPIVITTTATGSSSSLLPTTMSSAPLPTVATSQTDLVGSRVAATAPPFRGTLRAAVAESGKVTLVDSAAAVTTLEAGRYTIALSDRFAKGGVLLRRAGGKAQTLAASPFAGWRGISVTLSAGKWSLETSPGHAASFAVTG